MKIEGTYHPDTFEFGTVWADGRPLDPKPSQRLWNHSPDGFGWGYGGSGPAQLALALLLQAGLGDDRALDLHQRFKVAFIAGLPRNSFVLDVDIDQWVAHQR